jgi:formylmethanofuran dehydrogenase subunit B
LLCDDIVIDRSGDEVTLEPRCELGAEWLSSLIRASADAPAATIGGEATDVDTALTRAAELLRAARRPLIHGFERATVEDARAAVALADRLGTLVSTSDVAAVWPGAPAVPLRGASTATLGEIRDRSKLIVIWREDPETTHPRLLDRLGCGGSPPDRTVLLIDDHETPTARRVDARLDWGPDRDLEALTSLHVLQRGLALRTSVLAAALTGLAERLDAVPHAAFVYGTGLTAGTGGQRRALALHELVRALCHGRHVVTLELPRAAGIRGADDVLAWQTGYGATVDFSDGHPESVTATQWLDDVDFTLLVEPGPAAAAEIVLGSLPAGPNVDVWIRTAAPGVEASGTAHRLDGVPLALQAPLPADDDNDAPPTAAAVLTRLLDEVQR